MSGVGCAASKPMIWKNKPAKRCFGRKTLRSTLPRRLVERPAEGREQILQHGARAQPDLRRDLHPRRQRIASSVAFQIRRFQIDQGTLDERGAGLPVFALGLRSAISGEPICGVGANLGDASVDQAVFLKLEGG